MRVGFNLHPAFRATGGRVLHVSPDFHHIRIKLPLLRRTRNIVGSMYGGSLFAVTDGAHPMLMSALGSDHIVWDKAASIRYRKPAYTTLYVDFRLPAGKSRKSAKSWRASMKPPGRTRWNCGQGRRRLRRRGTNDLYRKQEVLQAEDPRR